MSNDALTVWLVVAGLIAWPLLSHILRDERNRRTDRLRRRWFRRN